MGRFRIAVLAAIVVLAVLLATVARPHKSAAAAPDAANSITVTGNGSVTTVPDRASFSFSVETRAAAAAATLTQNSAETRAVIAAVKAAGVAGEDVQTAQVSLSPQTDETGKVVGYIATNTISAKVRDLPRAGRIVDAAVGAGATGVGGPSLFRSDVDALYRAALKTAVVQARQKAEARAAAANISLGRVKSIVEGTTSIPMPVASAGKSGIVGPPIEPGTTDVTAVVTVTFATV